MAEERKKGRVTKVLLADAGMQPVAATSMQEADDPYKYGSNGLQEPPFNPEQLLRLSEQHSTHAAAIEQKTADITGTGWDWHPLKDGADKAQQAQLEEWFTGLADTAARDETTADILTAAWGDVETIGHGGIELARDGQGTLRKIYSIPAHTFRFHKDGIRIAQGNAPHRVWFKRWLPGDARAVRRKKGELVPTLDGRPRTGEDLGNEIMIFRRPTKRSSWYGIPNYVSAVGWIALSLAARDDNIHFFNNRREPRWAIILKNFEEDDGDLEQALKDAFATGLDKPHRNLFIPIEGEGDITFKQLSSDTKDVSFDRLQERAASEILIAHRVPPDRLGAVRVGPLGGNATMAASVVYKEGVVTTSQNLIADRINRFIRAEGPIPADQIEWEWRPTELDLTSEAEDTNTVVSAFVNNVLTWNEARRRLKLPPLEPSEDGQKRGDKFYFEIVGPEQGTAAGTQMQNARVGAELGGIQAALSRFQRSQGDVEKELRDVSDIVREYFDGRSDGS